MKYHALKQNSPALELRDWVVTREFGENALGGKLYGGGPTIPDGTRVYFDRTAASEEPECILVDGVRLRLGEPDPRYEARFPNARENLSKVFRQAHKPSPK